MINTMQIRHIIGKPLPPLAELEKEVLKNKKKEKQNANNDK